MTGIKVVMDDIKHPEINERIFLVCDECLWTVTCLNKIYLQETFGTNNRCPVCKQDRLSSFPVTLNDSFSYSFSKRREPELAFGIKK